MANSIDGFGLRVASAREAAGMTQRELGDRVGVSSMSMSRIERGQHTPDLSRTLAIARVLDVSLDWLAGRSSVQTLENKPTKSRR